MANVPEYDINNLTSSQISHLEGEARKRNAGEGQTSFEAARDQIRYEQLNYLKQAGNEELFNAYNEVEKTRAKSDQLGGLYWTPLTLAKNYQAQQAGNVQEDFGQVANVSADIFKAQGDVQSQAAQQALSLEATGKITEVGPSFKDKQRGVDVSAPPGTFAVVYDNGAVEFRQLPATGRIPSLNEIQASGRQAADVGAVGKDVSRTGETLFNPKTGSDVKAPDGQYVVEYADGTYEFRDKPAGGFVPSPGQLGTGGDSSAAQDITTAGKTLKELKADQGLSLSVDELVKEGASAEEIDQAIAGAGLKPTSELELLGKTFQGRTAGEGNLLYQDPETRKILERPEALEELALPSTSQQFTAIPNMFKSVFGREPSAEELNYWRGRTDKSGAALLGAMQFAKQQGASMSGEGTTSADPVTALRDSANDGQAKLASMFANEGIGKGSDEVAQLRAEIKALQAPKTESLKTFTEEQLASTQFQEAQNDLNQAKDALRQLDTNHVFNLQEAEHGDRARGLTTYQVRRNQSEFDIAYQRSRAQLVDEVQAYTDIVQSQLAITGMMIDAFKFDQNQAQVEYQNRLNKATTLYDMATTERAYQNTVQEQAENKARQNLAVVMGLVQEGAIDYNKMSSDQKSQIQYMEQVTGLQGVTEAMAKVGVKPVVSVGSTITAADGTPKTQIISQDPKTGELTISYYSAPFQERVPGGGGSGSGDILSGIGSLLGGVLGQESDYEIVSTDTQLESPPMTGWPNAKLEYPAGSGIIWEADSKGNWI